MTQMVIITDGEGWCNIEKIEVKRRSTHSARNRANFF